jgi:hypothetical protein
VRPPVRRSSRVLIVMPVEISGQEINGKAFRREAHTRVVNAHGALLILAAIPQIKPLIRLVNKRSSTEVQCRVAYRKEIENGTVELGVEFETPQAMFWGITFPPEDWSRADRKIPGGPSR